MKKYTFLSRAAALLIAAGVLISALTSCLYLPSPLPSPSPSDSQIRDPLANIPPTDPVYQYGEIEPGVKGKDIVYTPYTASSLEYSVTAGSVVLYERLLKECHKIYYEGSLEDEDIFLSTLYETVSYVKYFQSEYNVADLLFQLDTSDAAAAQTSMDAYKLWQECSQKYWHFSNEAERNPTALYDTLLYFQTEAFDEIVMRSKKAKEHEARIHEIRTEFASLPQGASQHKVLPVYLAFLKEARAFAQACHYDSYYDYASKEMYNLKYTKKQRETLRQYVKDYIVPAYREYAAKSDQLDNSISRSDYLKSVSYSKDDFREVCYVELFDYLDALPTSIGARMKSAFVYDRIVYATKSTADPVAHVENIGNTPIIYYHTDDLNLITVSHELGHYCYGLIEPNASTSYDLKEVHSTGNSLLFISYLRDKLDPQAYEAFCTYEISNILFQMIQSAIKDEFDELIYSMEDTDDLTVDDLNGMMDELIDEYGARGLTGKSDMQLRTHWNRHAISSPAYFFNYASAGWIALELYRISLEDFDRATSLYQHLLENVAYGGALLRTARDAGIRTPFDDDFPKYNEGQ